MARGTGLAAPIMGPRAFVLIDVVIGIAVLAILVVAFAAAFGEQRRASRVLTRKRAAVAAAELALNEWQVLEPAPGKDSPLQVQRLDGGRTLEGYVWVRVRTGTRSGLVGLARAAALDAATTPAESEGETQ